MKNIKRFLKIRYVFLGLLLWLVLRGSLNYTGFCWAEKRWLSDDEIMNNMIAVVNSEKLPFRSGDIAIDETNRHEYEKYKNYKLIPYNSVNEFKQLNPSCCKLDDYPHERGWADLYTLSRILGFQGYTGMIFYKVRYEKPDGTIYNKKIDADPATDNCGEAYIGKQMYRTE